MTVITHHLLGILSVITDEMMTGDSSRAKNCTYKDIMDVLSASDIQSTNS